MQTVELVHERPFRESSALLPPGLGLETMLQAEPLKDSTRVASPPAEVV